MNTVIRSFFLKPFFQDFWPVFLALMLVLIGFVPTSPAGQAADINIDAGGIYVAASVPGATFMMLRIAGPQGQIVFDQSTDGSPIEWLPPAGAQGGHYKWEVRVGVSERRSNRNGHQQPAPPVRPLIQSGTILIQGGAIVSPLEEEAGLLQNIWSIAKTGLAKFMDFLVPSAFADVLHYDDVIITGSECIGFDCQNGESFGFDTMILKEHNLRIYFNDTSYTSNYPTNNWRITINDNTNGGASYFAIDDVDGGTRPFTIEADAPSNSLYVDDYGRIGFGTSVPVVEIHTKDSDTPTLRLEQDSSGGWTAQTWDVAGNETNFFIRDVTNGSKLPFRIQPNAPSNSFCVRSEGKVGLGTWSPTAKLHVLGSDTAKILVQDSSTTTASRNLLELENNGAPRAIFSNAKSNRHWRLGMTEFDNFSIRRLRDGGAQFNISKSGRVTIGDGSTWAFDLRRNGNLTIGGGLTQNSDVNSKENFTSIDGEQLLARLRQLPISTWNYKQDATQARHLGPMAQDFYAAFRLGSDDRHISPLDAASVALAAIQELVREKDAQITELKDRLAVIEQKLDSLLAQGALENQSVAAIE